jgi:hypothetical protein
MKLSQGLQTELTQFAARQNAELQGRRQDIAVLDENTAVSAFVGQKQVMDWHSAGDDSAVRLYDEATSVPIGTQLAGTTTAQLLAPVSPPPSASFDPKAYDALVAALKPLADKRSFIENAQFLFSYGQAIADGMTNDVKTKGTPQTSADKMPKPETGNE